MAAQAFRPRLNLAPALLELPITLPEGIARVLLVNTLNLLPGTLSVGLEGNRLRLPVLDALAHGRGGTPGGGAHRPHAGVGAMTGLEGILALFLLLNLLAALIRAARGPTAADRMLAAMLFGTTGVGVLLLLAHAGDQVAMPLVDTALVLALLAAIAGVAFARRAWDRRK